MFKTPDRTDTFRNTMGVSPATFNCGDSPVVTPSKSRKRKNLDTNSGQKLQEKSSIKPKIEIDPESKHLKEKKNEWDTFSRKCKHIK
jgi:hypothetical protein